MNLPSIDVASLCLGIAVGLVFAAGVFAVAFGWSVKQMVAIVREAREASSKAKALASNILTLYGAIPEKVERMDERLKCLERAERLRTPLKMEVADG